MPRALFEVCGMAGIVWVAARSAIQSVSAMPPQMTGSGWTTSTARRPSSSTAALRDCEDLATGERDVEGRPEMLVARSSRRAGGAAPRTR